MNILGRVAISALAGLAMLTPAASAQTQESPDTVKAKLAEAKPAAKGDAQAEAKPFLVPVIDYVDFVFVASDRPVLLRLHLRNGGRSYQTAWDSYMHKMYTHLDRNNDGLLDKDEAARGLNIQFLQYQLSGVIVGFRDFQGLKGQMAQLDSNKDGKVSLAEFKEFYRRGGLAPLQFFSTSNRAAADLVTKTIYRRLDGNKDGKLSAEEMTRAAAALHRFDLDENELLTAGELRPGGEDNNPYGRSFDFGGASPNAEMGFLEVKPDAVDGVVRQVLTHFDKDKNGKLSPAESGLDKPLFDSLDSSHDGQLDAKELTGFFHRDADLELIARIGNPQEIVGAVVTFLRKVGVAPQSPLRAELFNPSKRTMPLATKVKRVDPSTLAFALGDAHIDLSASDQQFRQFPRQFYEQQYQQADPKKTGVVDRKQAMSGQFLMQFFDFADRDGDGKLTRKELNAYLDLQTEGSGCRLQLAITDEGRSLFELLDENGDTNLSLRELRTGWSRMKALAKSDSGLSPRDIARRLDVTIGQQQRRFRPAPAARPGMRVAAVSNSAPLWFQKMDRNQDGDVSRREFIGSDEDFRKLDSDGDGLISGAEARQFEERLKKEKVTKR